MTDRVYVNFYDGDSYAVFARSWIERAKWLAMVPLGPVHVNVSIGFGSRCKGYAECTRRRGCAILKPHEYPFPPSRSFTLPDDAAVDWTPWAQGIQYTPFRTVLNALFGVGDTDRVWNCVTATTWFIGMHRDCKTPKQLLAAMEGTHGFSLPAQDRSHA